MKKFRKQKKLNNKGFSLVELIVVIAIMAVLVAVLAPTLIGNVEKSREAKDFNTLDAVYAAVKTAYGDEAGNTAAKNTTKYPNLATGMKLSAIIAVDDAFGSEVKENLNNASSSPTLSSSKAGASGNEIMVSISTGTITVWVADSSNTSTISADKTKNADGTKKSFAVK